MGRGMEEGLEEGKVADDGEVVGEFDAGDAEAVEAESAAVADEVELAQGGPAGEGGAGGGVGADEAGGFEEEARFPWAGEEVEVAGEDAGFVGGGDDVVEVVKLAAAGAAAESEVGDVDDDVGGLDFDDEAFHAVGHVVEGGAEDGLAGEDGVDLVFEDGEAAAEALGGVFVAVDGLVAKLLGEVDGLVFTVGAVGAGVDFDKAGDVGINAFDEALEGGEMAGAFGHEADGGEALEPAGTVLDVMEEKLQEIK